MTQARLPMSVTASLALHVGGFLFYLQVAQLGPKATRQVISDVDLLIQVKQPQALPQAKPKAPTTLDFLKMALPAIPKVEPRRMEVKLPELKHPLLPSAPKLDDKGRLQELAKMQALDLSQRRVASARIEARLETRKVAVLAALPRLEEVGMRRVKDLPQAMALEERRQEAVALRAIQQMSPAAGRRVAGPAEVLREASPSERSRLAETLSSILPTQEPIALQPRAAEPAPLMKKLESAAPAAPRRAAQAMAEAKKGVEIEGPLADRKVESYDIPPFPLWAQQQGVIEAAVSIRFYVDPEGAVLSDMRIEHTSGYGRLDRLAMDSLRSWKFVPIESNERQWGIITFRFLLE